MDCAKRFPEFTNRRKGRRKRAYTPGMNPMCRVFHAIAWLALILMSGVIVHQAGAQQAGDRLYAVTHVDIIGGGGNLDEAIKLIQEYVADSQKDPGAVRIEFLQHEKRRNHFTLVEVWQTKDAFEAHTASARTKQFREKLHPLLGSPFDERLHSLLP
jgi:quinol monooxygenase YgiN